VLDWLVRFKRTRADEGASEPLFLAGNHDFGMACFVGALPADPETFQYSREQLETLDEDTCSAKHFYNTYKDEGTKAYGNAKLHLRNSGGLNLDSCGETCFLHPFVADAGFFALRGRGVSFMEKVDPHGMHGIGRRWGGSGSFQSRHSFLSYLTSEDLSQPFVQAALRYENGTVDGVSYAKKFHDLFVRRVSDCDGHTEFLRNMRWIVDVNLQGLCGLADPIGSSEKPCGPEETRVILTHAGIISKPLEEQEKDIRAMKNRDIWAVRLYETEKGEKKVGRLAQFQGRGEVLWTPSGSEAYHVSGHHSNRKGTGHEHTDLITDKCRTGKFGQKRVINDYSGNGEVTAVLLRRDRPVELISSSESSTKPYFHRVTLDGEL